MSERLDPADWLEKHIDAEIERIMYGDGNGGWTGLLGHVPSAPVTPEKLTRQLMRQRDRLEAKGRSRD